MSSPPHGDRSSSVADSPLLRGADLDDPEQFITLRQIPILDEHDDDPERGVVDEEMLQRIARNSNARVSQGDPAALILGHTRSKKYAEEVEQAPVVGFASAFHVAPYRGKSCLYADFHFRKQDHSYARSFPFRSVERLDSPIDVVDRIALLRTPPQRDLGIIKYELDQQHVNRICYARDFPPLGDSAEVESNSPPGGLSMPDTAAAAAPPAGPDIKAIMAEFIPAMVEAFRTALHEEAAPETEEEVPGSEHEQAEHYAEEPNPEYPVAEETEPMPGDQKNYAMGEAGGTDTFIPGADMEHRKRYERDMQSQAKKDKDRDEVIAYLYDKLVTFEDERERVNYERKLEVLAKDHEITPEHIKSLVAEMPKGLSHDESEVYQAKKEKEIRTFYSRRPSSANSHIPVETLTVATPTNGVITPDDRRKAVVHAQRNGLSFTDALKAVRGH